MHACMHAYACAYHTWPDRRLWLRLVWRVAATSVGVGVGVVVGVVVGVIVGVVVGVVVWVGAA